MKFLAIEIEKPNLTENDFAPHLRSEALKVLELYESGIIREIFFDQYHCAVIILEVKNLDDAREILHQLPLVQQGLIDFELRELKPYTGFTRLVG